MHTITPRMIRNAELAIKRSDTTLHEFCTGMGISYWTMTKALEKERRKTGVRTPVTRLRGAGRRRKPKGVL